MEVSRVFGVCVCTHCLCCLGNLEAILSGGLVAWHSEINSHPGGGREDGEGGGGRGEERGGEGEEGRGRRGGRKGREEEERGGDTFGRVVSYSYR